MTDLHSFWTLPDEPPTEPSPVAVSPPAATDDGPAAPTLPAEPPTGPLPPAAPVDDTVSDWSPYPPLPPRAEPPTGAFGGAEPPATTPPPGSSRRLPRGAASALAAAAIALAAGGVGGAIGVRTADHHNAAGSALNTTAVTTSGNNNTAPNSVIPPSQGLNVKAILAKVEPAVVDISSRGPQGLCQGTGIVVDAAKGLILTNAHVVEGGTQITVTAATDKQARSATVVGADTYHDVAVIKVDPTGLIAAELGNSSDAQVGDDVVAIGNALALRGDPSVTRGIISGLGRSVGQLTGMIQTDAAINPGNSGGPLVNAQGQVVGINTAIAGQAQNIGFAIPIDTARSIMAQLDAGTPVAPTAFLGVSTTDADDGSPGAVVADVTPGSPADSGGLRVGDRIIAIDGAKVPGSSELRGIVQSHKPDETVQVTVVRDGQEQTLSVKLGRRS